ncbi:MAG: glycosyltransferase family 4 protein [Planctomycetaceae bacterium]|nr:glycosyltransferase family 4 protein [Planctomycetaceae bacterium]
MSECLWRQHPSGDCRQTLSHELPVPVVGRVLHVVNGEHYAGAERVQDLLSSALPWFGYEAGIVCLKPGRFPEARKNRHAPLLECPMRGRLDLRPAGTLVRLIRRQGYDLLHAHTPRSLMVAAAASLLARVPLVYHVHSPATADTTSRLRNWVNAFLERLSLAPAAHLIAVSESLRNRYRKLGFSPDRITVVSNGVPCGASLRPRKRAAGDPVVFGMTALFRPRKGLENLLRSIARLRAEGRPLRLRAIGQFETSEYEQKAKRLAVGLGVGEVIDWTGFSSNVEEELSQIDCFVLPSLFGEGLPMVILEAMACGRPVIATDVEGTPEAIRHGLTGLLARPNDPASLADMMKQVIDGSIDVQAMVRRAADDQRRRFSVCSMARGVAEVYDRVLGRTGRSHRRDQHDLPCLLPASARPSGVGGTLLPLDPIMPIPPVRR